MSMCLNPKRAPSGWRPRGFTLVELLVVVSIIALLIAILLPSLRKAREQAKLATCLANMTGIAKASLTYAADDPGENMIPVPDTSVLQDASGALEFGGKSGIGQSPNLNNPALSVYGTAAYRGPAHRPLNLQLYKSGFKDYNPPNGRQNPGPGNINYLNDTKLDLPLYRCPSDTGYAGGGFMYTASSRADRNEKAFQSDGHTAYDHYGTSYTSNVFWIVGGLSGQQLRSQSVYLTPLSRVPAPAASIAYLEFPAKYAHFWGSWEGSGCEQHDYEGRCAGNYKTIQGWHRRDFGFDVAFADGHASTVEMKGTFRPAPNLGLANYPANVCGPSLNGYECERCITMRGPGWQLDTLPAASVLTPYFAD